MESVLYDSENDEPDRAKFEKPLTQPSVEPMIFIDTEAESWNMDPVALEKAFEMYPALYRW